MKIYIEQQAILLHIQESQLQLAVLNLIVAGDETWIHHFEIVFDSSFQTFSSVEPFLRLKYFTEPHLCFRIVNIPY
jgi:hypothetical protein